MFKFFNMKKVKSTPADEKLSQIENILFPPIQYKTDENGKKYMIDSSADMNLDAALYDLEDGHNDEVSRKTIRGIATRLYEVRKLLHPAASLGEAEYLIVDDLAEEHHDKIQAAP